MAFRTFNQELNRAAGITKADSERCSTPAALTEVSRLINVQGLFSNTTPAALSGIDLCDVIFYTRLLSS